MSNEPLVVLTLCEAMSTSKLKEPQCGGYQPQESPQIAAPGALPLVAKNGSKEKNRTKELLPAFGGQTALVAEVNGGSKKTAEEKACQRQSTAA